MNLIISAAVGMSAHQLWPLLLTAKRHLGNTKICLIVRRKDVASLNSLKSLGASIELVPVWSHLLTKPIARNLLISSSKWVGTQIMPRASILEEVVTTLGLHIALRRYLIARRILLSQPKSAEKVLLCDSRDVFFQADPFEAVGDKLICGLEKNTIGNCPSNSTWVRTLYGGEMLKRLQDTPIICSGVTLGNREVIERYLQMMVEEIWRLMSLVAFSCGYDQGIHNQILYNSNCSIGSEFARNEDGLIATVGYESAAHLELGRDKESLLVHGAKAAIVHQYDRHPSLREFVASNLCH